jgi:hypothetical protein
VPISELFEIDDSASAEEKASVLNQHNKRYWEMSQMAVWLSGSDGDISEPFIDELWAAYVKIVAKRNTSWDELKKSSARIPPGDLKATS